MSILDMQSKTRKRTVKVIEYKDAPSGKVKMYNYKEPFVEYGPGFGYYGVLLFDVDTDKVQCHLCGKWFDSLGTHISKSHHMTANEYKDGVGLFRKTALISERHREKLISNGQERFSNIRPCSKQDEETKKKISKTVSKSRSGAQGKNDRDICYMQVLRRLRELAEELGRTPTQEDCKGLYDNLVNHYGTYAIACEMAGIEVRKNGVNIKHNNSKLTDTHMIKMLVIFHEKHGRWPSGSDYRRELLPNRSTYLRRFGSIKEAIRLAKILMKGD